MLRVAPEAARWRTLLLASAAEIRPAAPMGPGAPETAAELAALHDWERRRGDDDRRAIAYWNDQPPPVRWAELAQEKVLVAGWAAPRAARALALVHVAVHDATLAAWDAKAAWRRATPAQIDASLRPLVASDDVPGYPSEHAAAAYAAAGVLAGLFPAHAERMKLHAWGAAESRVAAGANFPSDVAAGRAIGEAVAARALARAAGDGSDALVKLPLPTVAPQWTADYPAEALGGTWATWAIGDVATFALPAPPQPGEPGFDAALAQATAAARDATPAQREAATRWTAALPPVAWHARARMLVADRRPDAPHAARAMAGVAIALADATTATWSNKYRLRLQRPSMLPGGPAPLAPPPPHPAWPSDGAACAAAAAEVLTAAFPQDAAALRAEAEEAAAAGRWAGHQFERDVTDGQALGRRVAQAATGRLGEMPAP